MATFISLQLLYIPHYNYCNQCRYVLQYFKISSYCLSVSGLVCTIIGLLIMTDWQSIGDDPCMDHSLFHHPELINYYRLQLKDSNISDMLSRVEDYHYKWCSSSMVNTTLATYQSSLLSDFDEEKTYPTCNPVSSCANTSKPSHSAIQVIFHLYSRQGHICLNHIQTHHTAEQISQSQMLTPEENNAVLCTSGQNSISSCFVLKSTSENSTISLDTSLLAEVYMQSLEVVEGALYKMVVNLCESAVDHCHWMPNSQVTHKHCSDCQPICRSTQRTLNFVQFVIGLTMFFSTLTLLYTGVFLLLSDCVSKAFQVLHGGKSA